MKKFIGKKISFIFTFVFLLAMFSNSVLASTDTSKFSCKMYNRYVSGKDNDEFHGMDKGTMYISGTISLISKETWATPDPATIYIEVYEDITGIDRQVGYFTVKLNSNGDASFSKRFTTGVQPAGTYYIVMYTANDDGWNVECSGTLKTVR